MTSGGHPAKAFFGPDEPLPGGGDLQHVMGDGYIVISYRKTLPLARIAELEAWTDADSRGLVVLPSTELTDTEVHVATVRRGLSCKALDVDELAEFRESWFRQYLGGG
ncbi:MAG TPA: hypothetical protein VKA24_05980 [Gaiellaceae bacterium]|nr:hypothetical protein [Gaiellaceae bacterium]